MSSWGQQKQGMFFSMELQPKCFYNCISILPFLSTSRVLFFLYLPLIETISRKASLILIFDITYLYSSVQDPLFSVNVTITIPFRRKCPISQQTPQSSSNYHSNSDLPEQSISEFQLQVQNQTLHTRGEKFRF